MANVDSPFGLRPIRHIHGAPYNGGGNWYYIPSSYATALFIGDPVVKVANGSNTAALTAPGMGFADIGTLPEINKCTAGDANPITGVIVGFAANPDNLSNKHNPASTERVALVCDDPDVVFEIQADSAGTIPAANVGLNGNVIFTHAGSTTTGLSGVELNSSTEATTATFQLKILRAVNRLDNEATAQHAKFEVMINNHSDSNVVAGI